jgi:uncharacterized membrane protein
MKNRKLITIILGFGILYALISIVNHYLFRTYALDLGAYSNALYDYSHLSWNDSTVFKSNPENLLADHFDLYLILFAPLSLIFKTYTLLIVQIVFILFGGLGIYKYINYINNNERLAILATLFFFLFYGIYSALASDYHSNVIGACMVPWFFYFLKKKNLLKTILILVFILIGKENMSLWMAFICLGLIFEYRKEVYWRNFLAVCVAFCLFYFFMVTAVIMPSISNASAYPHFHYSALGSSYSEALTHIISHPIDSFVMFFTNHTSAPQGEYLKLELFIFLILSGLPILIKKPQYLLMLLPIFGQKLFHDNISMWGIHSQYSIEFAPILAIGIFVVLGEVKHLKLRNISSYVVIVLCLACTIRIMDSTLYLNDKSKIRVYQKSHFEREYPTSEIRKKLNEIPENAIVSAQSPFVSQLAYRDNIYEFPIVKDAEYLVYSIYEDTYPLNEERFEEEINKINASNEWQKECDQDGFVILKKR